MSGVLREGAYSTVDGQDVIPDNGLSTQIIGTAASWDGVVGAIKTAVCCNAVHASPSDNSREVYTHANQTKDNRSDSNGSPSMERMGAICASLASPR